MNKEFQKRIITSIFLLLLLTCMFFFKYILLVSLIIIGIIIFVEFNGLIYRIYKKKDYFSKIKKITYKAISILYISFFSIIFYYNFEKSYPESIFPLYLLMICIMTDLGGIFFGKLFKGKKLTKISPKKTISGSIGSFIFSLLLMFIFILVFNFELEFKLILITILVSLISQIGDILISFLKRKAKVKDTGDLLPGHGGFLDRLDGILFGFPMGFILYNFINF